VTDGVYVAVGFALANSIMIECPDGLVIVDTTESKSAAREILQEFRKVSQKPIKAVVLTHNHPDHTVGTEVAPEIREPAGPDWPSWHSSKCQKGRSGEGLLPKDMQNKVELLHMTFKYSIIKQYNYFVFTQIHYE
jgi:glyoxylase-like metal-dependent hydrolase (beta-lactamase superfamily II)